MQRKIDPVKIQPWFSFNLPSNNSAQMVNGLVETATQPAFWVHARLLEGVALVPAG